MSTTTLHLEESLAERATNALEHVCSGAGLAEPSRYYSAEFIDHVNDLEFQGLAGVERSVSLYRKLFTELRISVEQRLAEGDHVTCRYVVSGTSYGRTVRFNGITISRFAGGLIVEDWSVTDTLGMLRQLGWLRSLVVAARSLGTLVSTHGAPQKESARNTTCSRRLTRAR